MHTLYDLGQLAPLGPSVLSLGVFDGLHIGHRRVLTRAAEIARDHGGQAVAVVFWPHPEAVLLPGSDTPVLTMLEERLDLMAGLGVLDAAVVVPFSPELAALAPDAFLERLTRWCAPIAFVEGPDFAFGRNREGDLTHLREAGRQRGFTVETLDVSDRDGRVSSSRIRALIAEGQIEDATRLLGGPYRLVGEVIHGDKRGRELGYPTANLRLDPRKLLPANGIYAVRVRLPGEDEATHAGVASVGVRPTFGRDPKPLVEVFLLDASMDLYGLTLAVDIVGRLREERRYDSVDALIAQMAHDVENARRLLEDEQARPASQIMERQEQGQERVAR
jgi:riboflavin kinase/FMN adenylyltransferase